jgi:hypothetical protein
MQIHRRSKWLAGAAIVAGPLSAGAWIVTSAREAARQAQCINNLKQIGLALHNYNYSWDVFPPGASLNDQLPSEKRLSWMALALPYLEVGPRDTNDYFRAWDDDTNRFVRLLRCYLCPSNPQQRDPRGYGLTHYVGVAGLGTDAPELPVGHPRVGLFGYRRMTPLDRITDGTSNTMAVIETATANGPWRAAGPATVRGLDPAKTSYIGPGRQFGGNHRGGVLVLLVDGSVRFVRDTVDPRVFEGLSTTAGGEKLPGGWYQE